MTTARDVEMLLRRHYLPDGRPPGGLFAPEIMSPDGKRRADVMWMETTTVGRGTLHGHEIKVSRADVIHELADPTKMDAWARFCDFWWLVVCDPALITGLDIPEHWGIMAPPSGRRTRSMTILRKATRLHPIDKTEAVTRLLIWQHHQATDKISGLEQEVAWRTRSLEATQAENTQLRLHGATVDRPDTVLDQVRRIVARYQEVMAERANTTGVYELRYSKDVTDEDIIAALVELGTVRSATKTARQSLERSIAALEGLADPLARARTILTAAGQA